MRDLFEQIIEVAFLLGIPLSCIGLAELLLMI